MIFSTHDMNVAEKMCDFIFMIFKGRKVLDGTLDSIQDEYGSDTIRLRTEERRAGLAGSRRRGEGQRSRASVQELQLARRPRSAGDPRGDHVADRV